MPYPPKGRQNTIDRQGEPRAPDDERRLELGQRRVDVTGGEVKPRFVELVEGVRVAVDRTDVRMTVESSELDVVRTWLFAGAVIEVQIGLEATQYSTPADRLWRGAQQETIWLFSVRRGVQKMIKIASPRHCSCA